MNNSSLVGGLDCISISSDSQISIMDILNEQLFQNKAENLPNYSKTQQLPKKLDSNNQVPKQAYSVEQIKSLINTRAFTGYSIVDAKKAEEQLSVILFASKAKARDVLHAKTTLRNTRSSPDSYCCCYYQKHKRYRILQQIQEEREAIQKLKKYEKLDSIFGVDQEINQSKNKKAEGKQDPNTPCKKTRRSFKNKCSKACANHELAIIDHLDSLNNKYLLTSLTREEYSQQWLQDNVFTHFETREFYTLNENNQQYSDHSININQQQKNFQDKNREEMITFLKQQTKYDQYSDDQLVTMCERVDLLNKNNAFKLKIPQRVTHGSCKRYKGKVGQKGK
ncbi:Hypothetical_protein [Hexamita inflata]|uniref:Hypothetical_protein n=1 Tax=Hexamita inflata TaxID=28002 RepID=A0AA86TRY8_9EUKA|nr:Hypothetical protein HINF_LOCUS14011 [Hexamita inflata]